MKRILFLLLLLPAFGFGQGISIPSANPTTTAWVKGAFIVDSIQVLALRDTVWPSWWPATLRKIGGIVIRSADSLPYFYTGVKWTAIATGTVSGADSAVFATQYQVDTAKANIYAAISGGSADSSVFATIYRTDTMSDNLYALAATKVKYSDTAAMLANYLRESDTTAMLSVYLRKVDTATLSTRIDARVKYTDTAAMLSPYLREIDTTAMLANYAHTNGDNATGVWPISITGSAPTWTVGRTLSITGDLGYTSPSFDGSGNVTAAGTLATVNGNVGSFGSATQASTFTVNGKGLITAAGNVTVTPAVGSITGLGIGVATALGVNVGNAGSFVVNGGALGTPSSGTATNLTGTAAGLTAGTVTTNADLTGDVTSLGNATTLATVNANVGSFGSTTSIPSFTVNGKGLITAASGNVVIAPAGTLTGNTLASGVLTTSITGTGTLTAGSLGTGYVIGRPTMTLGSDADGDMYYRSGGVLTREATGTTGQSIHPDGSGGYVWLDTVVAGTGDLLAANNLNDVVDPNTSLNNLLPAQGGNAGKVLETDGSNASWETPAAGGGADTSALSTNTPMSSTLDTVYRNGINSALWLSTERIGVLQDASVTTQTSSVIQAVGAGAAINLVLWAKGTGNILADVPDGASTGGSARGTNCIDLQTSRSNANQVASGFGSVIIGGDGNRASVNKSTVVGGDSHHASGIWSSIIGGSGNTSSGTKSFIGGGSGNVSSGQSSVAFGERITTPLYGQLSTGAVSLGGANGTSQTSIITMGDVITGTAINELFLDGTGSAQRAIMSSNRIWNGQIQIVATTVTVGNGTGTLGHSWVSNHTVGIKNIGGTTALIGTVQAIGTAQSDLSMATSVVTIDANDTNDALRIQFTPPSTAGSTTLIRVVATIILAEVAY